MYFSVHSGLGHSKKKFAGIFSVMISLLGFVTSPAKLL